MKIAHKGLVAIGAIATTAVLLYAPTAMAAESQSTSGTCPPPAVQTEVSRYKPWTCPTATASPSVSPSVTASPTVSLSPSPSVTATPSASTTVGVSSSTTFVTTATLPVTGGSLTTMIVVGVGLLMLGAGALFVTRRRRDAEL